MAWQAYLGGMKWLLALLIAAGFVTMAPSAPAQASDRRPCVSKVEFNSGFGPITYTRRELEERWEVRGLGVRAKPSMDISGLIGGRMFTVVYPRCAFSMEDAWYSVTYLYRTKEVVATTRHHILGTQPHGHE